ncbi:7994_t:CDS:2 [Ambispora gerdemannii]|uniref:7994_t:CDS:1 n=1 Tax=Ambispora gerdemannii TaxID=144530 RepID=A0A9N9FL54_9GLOM|nr:7994_t:CDS:2 [Ambispora gerdemannii]
MPVAEYTILNANKACVLKYSHDLSIVPPNEAVKPDIGDIYRDSLKAYEEYDACLTITIYGETYLDPEKCKARGFDAIKAFEEEEERTKLSVEWIERTTKEKGFRVQFQEFLAKIRNLWIAWITPQKAIKKASYIVDHKIKFEDELYVKVVAVKMNKDDVF